MSVSARLLHESRDLATQRLGAVLPDLMDKVDDALFDLADKAETSEVQRFYFDAMREVRLRRATIEAEFRICLADAVNQRLRRAPGTGEGENGPEELGAEKLLLVDDDELEESLAVTNMAGKIRSACKPALYLLDRRMGFLLGEPELQGEANPLGPEAICGAFKEACGCVAAGIQVKLLVLKLFDRFVVHEMESLYDSINTYLVEHEVLPDLKPTVEVRRGPPRPRSPSPGTVAVAPPGSPGSGSASGAAGAGYPGAPAGPSAGGSVLGGGGSLSEEASRLLDVLQSLMQSGVSTPTAPPAPVITALTALQAQAESSAGPVAVGTAGGEDGVAVFDLRSLKGAGFATVAGAMADVRLDPMNEMMIDIVAMMFDYILDDEDLPLKMRALIGRLQIPVLKVALLDRSLFSRRFHPVRRLLNTLSETAVGWDEDADSEDTLYAKMDELVRRILDEFDDDIAVFASVLEALEAYLAEEERERQGRIEHQARALRRRQRLEEAKRAVKREVRRALEGSAVTPIVKLFLTRYWAGYLVVTHVRQGPGSEPWARAIETMDRLVWSVTPKETADERARLLRRLPTLLRRLNAGLDKVTMPAAERDELLAALASRHAELVRGPGREDAAPAGVPAEEEPQATPPVRVEEASIAVHEGPQEGAPAEADAGTGESTEMPARSAPAAGRDADLGPEHALLARAVGRANRRIFDAQAADPGLRGMGTTVVAAIVRDNRIHYAYAGDSRLYRWRAGRLTQMSRDHSLAQELVDRGFYTPEEVGENVSRTLVTRGLGIEATVEAEFGEDAAEPGDVYMLCSDGLSDMVDDRQIEAIVGRYQDDPDKLAGALVDCANDNGGRDNISALVARVVKPFPLRQRWHLSRSLGGRVQFAGRTDVGRTRSGNEDSIGIDPAAGALVVADGMGGLRAGEVASALAVRTLMEDLARGIGELGRGSSRERSEGHDPVPGSLPTGPDGPDVGSADVDLRVVGGSYLRAVEGAGPEGDASAARREQGDGEPLQRMLGLLDRVDVDLETIVLDGTQVPGAGATGSVAPGVVVPLQPRRDGDDRPNVGGGGAPDDGDRDVLAFLGGLPPLDDASQVAAGEGDEYERAASALAVGNWVELELEGGRHARTRLSWVNQATGVCLFTDRRGLQVAERTVHGLAVELRRGAARILQSVPLYDRAVTSLLEHLRNGTDGG